MTSPAGITIASGYVPAPSGAAGRLEQRFHLNAIPAEKLAEAPPGAEVHASATNS